MPILARDEFRILIGMNGHDFGMVRQAGDATVNRELTESPAKFLVPVMVQVLVTQENDLMFHEGRIELIDDLVRQRLRKIDAFDLRADPRRHRFHFQDFVSHHSDPAH